jgi:hypothetical protein
MSRSAMFHVKHFLPAQRFFSLFVENAAAMRYNH